MNVENVSDTSQTPDVSNLMESHHHYLSAQINLWAIFIAATVTTAGITYGTLTDANTAYLRIATLFGFSAFAIGHWHLLKRTRSIYISIERLLSTIENHPLQSVIDNMSSETSGTKGALIAHLVIDLAVVSFILSGFWPV